MKRVSYIYESITDIKTILEIYNNQIKKYQNYSPTIVGEFVRISKTGNIYKIEQY